MRLAALNHWSDGWNESTAPPAALEYIKLLHWFGKWNSHLQIYNQHTADKITGELSPKYESYLPDNAHLWAHPLITTTPLSSLAIFHPSTRPPAAMMPFWLVTAEMTCTWSCLLRLKPCQMQGGEVRRWGGGGSEPATRLDGKEGKQTAVSWFTGTACDRVTDWSACQGGLRSPR